jgi:hypothetical protein
MVTGFFNDFDSRESKSNRNVVFQVIKQTPFM